MGAAMLMGPRENTVTSYCACVVWYAHNRQPRTRQTITVELLVMAYEVDQILGLACDTTLPGAT